MSLCSMTGFGRAEGDTSQFSLVVEIKTVNNRFKDFRFKMPATFNAQELEMRKLIEHKCHRGSFDIQVNLKRKSATSSMPPFDRPKIENTIDFFKQVASQQEVSLTIHPGDFISSDFFQEKDEEEIQALNKCLRTVFNQALDNLIFSRREEGEKLSTTFFNQLESFTDYCGKVSRLSSSHEQLIKDKLNKRLKEMATEVSVDQGRIVQEIAFLLEKADISEELERLNSHIQRTNQVFKKHKEVGRELEFLLQELGRETNTIGSKSILTEISDYVVQMKVILEKMREQSLNIE